MNTVIMLLFLPYEPTSAILVNFIVAVSESAFTIRPWVRSWYLYELGWRFQANPLGLSIVGVVFGVTSAVPLENSCEIYVRIEVRMRKGWY